jgi:hypothetical protein
VNHEQESIHAPPLTHLQSPPDVLIDALTAHGLITDEPALTAMH